MKLFSASLLAGLLFTPVHADQLAKEFCTTMPGFWVGEEHIRDNRLCDMFNGCTHMVTLNITHKEGSVYQLEDQWSDGQKIHSDTVPFTCENGAIKLPTAEKYEISARCDAGNHCFAFVNNPRFTAEFIKQ